jgi:hypothetical protein
MSRLNVLLILLLCNAGLERAGRAQRRHPICHGPLRLAREGAEPKPLVDRLDEAEGCIKGLLLDTTNHVLSAALSTVKHHDPSFDLQKVSEDMDLLGLIRREDIVAAMEEVVKKFDFGTD